MVDNRYLSKPFRVLKVITLAFIIILGIRLFFLQIIDGRGYLFKATKNFIVEKQINAERGIIYDRNQKPLLINKLSFDLVINPSIFSHTDTFILKPILKLSGKEILQLVKDISIKNGYYRPSIVKFYLNEQEYTFMLENQFRTSIGVYLQKRPTREYLYKAASHILGYLGEADSSLISNNPARYSLGDFAGVRGLEKQYEFLLAGKKGKKYFVRDNHNRIVSSFNKGSNDTVQTIGSYINISIDIELQKLGEELMQNKLGSIVAIEPATGQILALISSPGYDANQLSNQNRSQYYSKLVFENTLPLYNRALKGLYSPGSTIKPLLSIIGLDLGMVDENSGYPCRGYYKYCGRRIACEHSNQGHASNLQKAVANSCNSYFSHLFSSILKREGYSTEENLQIWKSYLNNFGLGKNINIDIPGNKKGFVPDTLFYKKYFGKHLKPCNVASLGIGQAELLVSPLQLANMACIIANRGYYYLPHFFVGSNHNELSKEILEPYHKKIYVSKNISPKIYENIVLAMNSVVENGTARNAKIDSIAICAKTGTVQNKRKINGALHTLPSHSLFIGFAPMDNPQIAIAVVVENAGYGSRWASPIASLIMEQYLRKSITSPYRQNIKSSIAEADLTPSIYK